MSQTSEIPIAASILLVDDEPANLLALHAVLDDMGHRLVDARSGEEALRLLRDEDFAVILLDVLMAGTDGFETARQVRNQPRSQHTPIIFLTAHDADRPTVEQAYALGAVDFLVKPLVPIVLRAKVAAFVDLFQKSEQIRRQGERLRQADQREHDRAIGEQRERFRALVTASSDAVYRMSPDWTEMRFLQGREFMPDTLEPSRSWMEKYIHPEDQAHVMEVIRQAIRTKSVFELEHRVIRTDGTLGWTFSRAVPILDVNGEIVEWFGAASDVTRRKEAEQSLLASQAESERQRRLYEAILSNTPDLAYIFDLNHRFIYANEVLLRMWGKTWDEAIGKNCLELGYEPWHAAMHDREIEHVKATKQPIRGEVPFTGTFGRRIYDYIFVPVIGANGEVEAVAGTTRDVTDRQQMEETLRQQAEQLREANRHKDEFLGILAHELRNPLAPLRNGLQIMRMARGNAEATEQARSMMERQLQHLVRLVDDLLDVSRISRGKILLKKERIELATVVSSALEMCQPLFKQQDQELTVTLPEEPVYVEADKIRLAQAVCNLVSNASKFSDRRSRIWLTVEREGAEAVIRVKDNGVGIPAPMLSKVFDMFTQVDRSLEKVHGGLGIGLSLVKGLVEMHAGSVEARSEGPGMGSEFIIRLPVVLSVMQEQEEPASDAPAPQAPRRRILIVDDNVDAASSLAMMLKMMGHDVRTSHDGFDGVAAATAYRPDLILLDLGMPRLNGYDACRRIREQPWGKGMVIIALTGWGQEEDRRRSQEAGFNHHLVKPVELASLDKLLAELKSETA